MSPVRALARLAVVLPTAMLSSAAVLTVSSSPAQAQLFGFFDPPAPAYRARPPQRSHATPRVRRERPERREVKSDDKAGDKTGDKAASAAPQQTSQQMVYAVVSLADQHIDVYGGDGLIARSRVSSGQAGFRTPTGIFGILEKHRDHESNIYDAEMPFMQRLTWSGVALHQGIVPRYPASHGCIRLPASFAARLWTMTNVGARVVVSSRAITPADITHPLLPQARMVTADLLGIQADAGTSTSATVQVAAAGGAPVVPQPDRRYNPIEAAGLLKARAQAEVTAARKTAEKGLAEARAAAAAANAAAEAVRDIEGDLADARAAAATPPEKIADLERRLAEARTVSAQQAPRALETALVVRDAERAAEAAREAQSEARRRAAPLSVLISAKEGLVMVKQGTRPVYEAPFTLRDPDKPLGTHLFVATAPLGDDGHLRWSALTVPQDGAAVPKRRGDDDEAPKVAPERPGASTAGEALDRVTLTPETQQKLSELIWVGGSIIVTDRGLSPDYGEMTDMVVAIP